MANYNKGKRHHFIYKTTNLINGKYYIGMHSTNNLEDGYLGSGKKLRRSINKYGIENFKCEILEFLTDRDSLAKREKEIVNDELLKDTMCMNLKEGGSGGLCNDDHRDKFLKSSMPSRWNNPDAPAHMRLKELNKDLDWKREKSKKIKAGLNRVNHKHDTFKGKCHSIESKQKISNSLKGRYANKQNSQYGTCWITNGNDNKKIKKENLETFINLGWKRGRVFI